MGKIICFMGKSAAGKDTIYKKVMSDPTLALSRIVPYTTRPMREGETHGIEYYFTDEAGFQDLKARGRIIEDRAYNTKQGIWRYFTVADHQLEDPNRNYGTIGTLVNYVDFRRYFGDGSVVPVFITVEDGLRLQRALEREMEQKDPKYAEMCRRFLADCEDFSPEKIRAAGIEKAFENRNLDTCIAEIKAYIQDTLGSQ